MFTYDFSPTAKKQIAARSLKPQNCTRCRFNCADKVPENIRLAIFNLFYDENMVYEMKRDFICKHIDVQPVSKRYSGSFIIGKDIICCRIESKVSSDVLLAGVCFPLLSVTSKVP
jgi:hypothetical protein